MRQIPPRDRPDIILEPRSSGPFRVVHGPGVDQVTIDRAIDHVAGPFFGYCVQIAPYGGSGFLFDKALTGAAHVDPIMVGPLLETAPEYIHGSVTDIWNRTLLWIQTRTPGLPLLNYNLSEPLVVGLGDAPEGFRGRMWIDPENVMEFWPGGFRKRGDETVAEMRELIKRHLLHYHMGDGMTPGYAPRTLPLDIMAAAHGLTETDMLMKLSDRDAHLVKDRSGSLGMLYRRYIPRFVGAAVGAQFTGAVHYPGLLPTMSRQDLDRLHEVTTGLPHDRTAAFYGGPGFWGHDFQAWINPSGIGAPLSIAYSAPEVLDLTGPLSVPKSKLTPGLFPRGDILNVSRNGRRIPPELEYVVRLSSYLAQREVGIFRTEGVYAQRTTGGLRIEWIEGESPYATTWGHSGAPVFTLGGRYLGPVTQLATGYGVADIASPLLRDLDISGTLAAPASANPAPTHGVPMVALLSLGLIVALAARTSRP